ANIVGGVRTLRQKCVGQVEQFLEVTVPGRQPQIFVEHSDAIGHVVEGRPQLGLTLANLVEQPRVLHRDNCLGCEVLQQRDLPFGERSHFLTVDVERAEQNAVLSQRYPKQSPSAAQVDNSTPQRVT